MSEQLSAIPVSPTETKNKLHLDAAAIECCHTRDRQPCVIGKTAEHFSKTKKLNSQGINLRHQHGRRDVV